MAPFASTNPIINVMTPGDFIYFRGGEYGKEKGQIAISEAKSYSIAYIRRNDEKDKSITFKAYLNENPVIDL